MEETEEVLQGVAKNFLLNAIQEWGQSEEQKLEAVQSMLNIAGFNAKATCAPIYGRIWPKKTEGIESEEATQWLKEITESLPRGKFETELEYLIEVLKNRVLT